MDAPSSLPQRNVALNSTALHYLQLGGDEHLPPEKILAGLSGEDACALLSGAPHSIATLVAHMTHWQQHCVEWIRGTQGPAAPIDDSINFPVVAPEQWEALRRSFLESLSELEAVSANADSSAEFYKGRSLGWFLANQALHNTYHLGQIALLRKLQGNWPSAD